SSARARRKRRCLYFATPRHGSPATGSAPSSLIGAKPAAASKACARSSAQPTVRQRCTARRARVGPFRLLPSPDPRRSIMPHEIAGPAGTVRFVEFAPAPGAALGNAPQVELLPATAFSPEATRWLWPHWLAHGKFHLLAGAPGTGKTTIALTLAA